MSTCLQKWVALLLLSVRMSQVANTGRRRDWQESDHCRRRCGGLVRRARRAAHRRAAAGARARPRAGLAHAHGRAMATSSWGLMLSTCAVTWSCAGYFLHPLVFLRVWTGVRQTTEISFLRDVCERSMCWILRWSALIGEVKQLFCDTSGHSSRL